MMVSSMSSFCVVESRIFPMQSSIGVIIFYAQDRRARIRPPRIVRQHSEVVAGKATGFR
jgi:hypothetical protein